MFAQICISGSAGRQAVLIPDSAIGTDQSTQFTGAGLEMRRVLGTAVFSGMLGANLFGLFLIPVF